MTTINSITDNVEEIITEINLLVKLKSGKKLNIKLGADPTKPDLHLGHLVALRKLKQFQDLGHNIIFLIGDFTAKIGDPSGRNITRPILTDEEIEQNVKTWITQVGKVIDVTKAQIRYNSEWFLSMNFQQWLNIIGKVSLSNVTEREDFQKRIKGGDHIALSEIMYPVMQGYDSVVLKSDVELGGQDQKLNMLMGRDFQSAYGQEKQDIITMPLLLGTDGRKMSKSYDNYIGLNDHHNDAYGKLMSISDELIEQYLKLATDFSAQDINEMLKEIENGANPRDIKAKMAERIISMYWGEEKAKEAKKHFETVFVKKENPEGIELVKTSQDEIGLIDALVLSGFASSNSQARRLITQSAVKVEGEVVEDEYHTLDLGSPKLIQVGKRRFIRIGK